jgi:hypothetical protein
LNIRISSLFSTSCLGFEASALAPYIDLIAFCLHASAHLAQSGQVDGLTSGCSYGASCLSTLWGHASAAAQIPFSQSWGRHLL